LKWKKEMGEEIRGAKTKHNLKSIGGEEKRGGLARVGDVTLFKG